MNHGDDAVDVPPFEGAGFHKHAESRAGLDGIKPIIVLKTVTEDDFVQVIHAAMRTVRADGFILRLLDTNSPFSSTQIPEHFIMQPR